MKHLLYIAIVLLWPISLFAVQIQNISNFCAVYVRLYSLENADKKYHAAPNTTPLKIDPQKTSTIAVPPNNRYLVAALDKAVVSKNVLERKEVEGASGWFYGVAPHKEIKVHQLLDKADDLLYIDVELPPKYEHVAGLRCNQVPDGELKIYATLQHRHKQLWVTNEVNFPLYYAVYQCQEDRTDVTKPTRCKRTSRVAMIGAEEGKTIMNISYDIRALRLKHYKAYIIFSLFEEDLTEERPLGRSEMRKIVRGTERLPEASFDLITYNNMSAISINHTLNGLRIKGKGIVRTVSRVLQRILKGQAVAWSTWFTGSYQAWAQPFQKAIDRMVYNPLRNTGADVRSAGLLNNEEKQTVFQREFITHPALQKEIGQFSSYPNIGICTSGGGYRAMISSLGFVQGLSDTGIFDMSLYWAGLSGSTWLMSKYLVDQLSFDQLRKNLVRQVAQGLAYPQTQIQLANVVASLFPKYVYQQVITLTDLYGAALAYNLFDPWTTQKPEIRFSDLRDLVRSGKVPVPIGTAVSDDGYWFEFTPFEMGSFQLNGFIPMWAFGRSFVQGQAVDNAIEPPLYYLMGTFGSAYALKGNDFIKHVVGADITEALKTFDGYLMKQELNELFQRAQSLSCLVERLQPKEIRVIEKETVASPIRVPGGIMPNMFYHKKGSPSTNKPYLELRDAGIAFNLPFPPLLHPRRALNVIITWDASGDILTAGARELQEAVVYAQKHNLRFPTITPAQTQKAGTQNITVFGNPDNSNELTIIYIPLIKNNQLPEPYKSFEPLKESFTGTFNFGYTKEQASTLIEYARQNVLLLKNQIINVIKRKAQAMNNVPA